MSLWTTRVAATSLNKSTKSVDCFYEQVIKSLLERMEGSEQHIQRSLRENEANKEQRAAN